MSEITTFRVMYECLNEEEYKNFMRAWWKRGCSEWPQCGMNSFLTLTNPWYIINSAFDWSDSSEGDDYWRDIYVKYRGL